MNRRGFLGRLTAGLVGTLTAPPVLEAVLDPERALWVPGKKTIFLPPTERFVIAEAGRLDALDAEVHFDWRNEPIRTPNRLKEVLDAAKSYAKRGLLQDDVEVTRWSHEIGGYVVESNRVENGIITGIDVRPLHPGRAPVQGAHEWPYANEPRARASWRHPEDLFPGEPLPLHGKFILTDSKE